MTFVVPRLTGVFEDLGAELPLPTRVLLAITGLFTHWWWALLGGYPATARKHVWRAVRLDPTSRDNVKLLVSALRGR